MRDHHGISGGSILIGRAPLSKAIFPAEKIR
jgi:hypothetical protein